MLLNESMNVMLKDMKRDIKRIGLRVAMVGLLLAPASAGAQDSGYWRAASSSSMGVTGDVAFGDARLTINLVNFPMARIRDLAPGEASAAFDLDSNAAGSGGLYRLSIPASKVFLHRNTLCGSEETQWMASYVTGHSLHLAFFSGAKMPVFTLDAISNSTDLCGIYNYSR